MYRASLVSQSGVVSQVVSFSVSGMSLATTSAGYSGGWATFWRAEKMLDGQRLRVDVQLFRSNKNLKFCGLPVSSAKKDKTIYFINLHYFTYREIFDFI